MQVVDELLALACATRLVRPNECHTQTLAGPVDRDRVVVVGVAGAREAVRRRDVVGGQAPRTGSEVEDVGEVRLAPALIVIGVGAVAEVRAGQAVSGVDERGLDQRSGCIGEGRVSGVAALFEVLVHKSARARNRR